MTYLQIIDYIQAHDSEAHGPGNMLTAAGIAAMIKHDRDSQAGQYRLTERYLCPVCTNRKGVEPPTIAMIYTGPGGEQLLELPERLFPKGKLRKESKIPAQAVTLEDAPGQSPWCKKCSTYFLIVQNRDGKLEVWKPIESEFGVTSDSHEPYIAHTVPNTSTVRHLLGVDK